MDSESTQEITIKKACISCGREFAGDVTVCPEDHTPLTALAQDKAIGAIIADRYEILGILGKGGMGRVYKARHRLMKRIVAIKMLFSNLVSTASTLKRFQQEAAAAGTLSHQNILTIFDFGLTEDGQPYLVMDFLEGTSLAELLQEEGNLNVDRILRIFTQVASGLAHAHQKGVIHRDLKPSNIMLITSEDNPDFVKIVDFGIAKMVSMDPTEAEPLTRTGEVFGSPMYMSPEQCRGQQLDLRTDIYSLGCVMYRAATGLSPFMGHDQLECMFKQVNEEPGTFSEVCPDLFLPDELEAVIFKALAKKPEDRYQTMSELRQALESLTAEAIAASVTAGQKPLPERQQVETVTAAIPKTEIGEKTEQPITAKIETSEITQIEPRAALSDSSVQSAPDLPADIFQKYGISKRWFLRATIGFVLGMLGAVIAWSYLHHRQSPTATPQEQPASTKQPPAPGQPVAPVESAQDKEFDQQMKAAQEAFNKGILDDAERYALQAMNTAKTLPDGDKKYASSLNFLGSVNYRQGQYDEAATYLQKALRLRQKVFGDKSAEVADTKTLLGRAWSALGKYTKAEIVLDQALSTRQSLFGQNDLLVADTLSALADVDLREKKYADAAQELTRSLDITEIVEGKETLDAATAMNNLAQVYQLQHNYAKAMPLYAQALKIRQSKLKEDNPLIADSYICLGALCAQTGQIDQAKALIKSALAIQEKSLDPNSPLIATTRQRLANLNKRPTKAKTRSGSGNSFSSWLAK